MFSSKVSVCVFVYDRPQFFKLLTGIFRPSQVIPTNVAVYRIPDILSLRPFNSDALGLIREQSEA